MRSFDSAASCKGSQRHPECISTHLRCVYAEFHARPPDEAGISQYDHCIDCIFSTEVQRFGRPVVDQGGLSGRTTKLKPAADGLNFE
jgi:hypothetical protein